MEVGGYARTTGMDSFQPGSLKACRACHRVLAFCSSAPAGVHCDGGATHAGEADIGGKPCMTCFACSLDWCEPCANEGLQDTVGAEVVRIYLRHDTSGETSGVGSVGYKSREPTLKLGWAHAVSIEGMVAYCGPAKARDHHGASTVPREKFDEMQRRCAMLQNELDRLRQSTNAVDATEMWVRACSACSLIVVRRSADAALMQQWSTLHHQLCCLVITHGRGRLLVYGRRAYRTQQSVRVIWRGTNTSRSTARRK